MLLKDKKLVEKEVVTAVKCDMCEKLVEPAIEGVVPEHGKLSAQWGYGSKRDGEIVEYHICESCFRSLEVHIAQERRTNTIFED